MTVSRRGFVGGLCACSAWPLLAYAQDAAVRAAPSFVAPGYRPAPETDERGLWSMMERAERELAASRFVVRDAGLTEYVGEITCRLARDHCRDVRTYVVRTPHFNASMAANGMMQVWTGTLLRCLDEAQFAAIVGHELGHYLRRHSLDRLRDLRAKADIGAFLSLGLAAAGVGGLAGIAQLVLVASMFAYTRDQEREADDIGLRLMTEAGYAPVAASEVWEQLIDERAASSAEERTDVFFATHPQPEERLTTLRAAATGGVGERFRDRYRKMLAPMHGTLLRDEVRLRQYGRSDKVLDRLLAAHPSDAEAWFAKGEIARLRAGEGDLDRAREAYLNAERTGGASAEVHRALGQIELSAGRRDEASRWFERYLEARPHAADREVIRALLQ